jgi:NAD(P)-dependent dehydrogenase (short-subunit alcohol dehydrogenase family)
MAMRLDGKVALVTGAASGIGSACAERLARDGANVFVTDIQDDKGEAVAADIRKSGGRAIFLHHDVTQEAQWVAAIGAARGQFGALHVLVNNAGIGRPARLTEMSLETWRLHQTINLEAAFLGMKHAIPLMQESGGGSIVSISSVAGMKAYANMTAYCASKAGLRHFTKAAALECAHYKTGVRVNSVHPGIVDTPAWADLGGLVDGRPGPAPDLNAMAAASVPLGVAGSTSDIAEMVAFLAGDESRYITGAEFVVDGGQLIA